MNMEQVVITEEEYRQALDWLEDEANKDKWENYCGFKLLVPRQEVPEYVAKFIDANNQGDEFYEELAGTLDKLGLGN